MNKKEVLCPECRGNKGERIKFGKIETWQACWYCAGTGFQASDDMEAFEEFWKP